MKIYFFVSDTSFPFSSTYLNITMNSKPHIVTYLQCHRLFLQ